MIDLKDAVHNKPTFEKVSEYELPREISEWNEEILQQFYSDINYLPKDLNVDIAVNNIDENKGYAKGSIVVFTGENKINFPVVVKDYKLSPFDTFVDRIDGKQVYKAASLRNIKSALASEKTGKLENYWGKGDLRPGVKATAGIYPKKAISISDEASSLYPQFSKMSGWIFKSKKEDIEKLAIQMEASPDVAASFVDNTGDLIGNILDIKNNDNYQEIVADDHKQGDLDLNNVVKAKQVVTAIDSELINPNDLTPIKPPSVCEVRLHTFPTMEDFLESGSDMGERFLATRIGKPVSGVVLDLKENNDNGMVYGVSSSGDSDEKKIRNSRPQIFISACGCYYSICHDWDKTGISFYGSKTLDAEGALEKVIGMISSNTSDDFINQNRGNRRDGSDKLFTPVNEMNEGKDDSAGHREHYGPHSVKIIIIYGAGNAYECTQLYGNFKKYKVNDSNVYVSEECAIIPANVASVQKVTAVKDPMYKMVVGKAKNIYLIPEGSIIINTEYVNEIEKNEFITPDNSIRKSYEDASISKIAVYVSRKGDDLGYRITGKPFSDLEKIAGVNGAMSTNETLGALKIMGTGEAKAKEILKIAMNRYADGNVKDKNVIVYGVNDDYINGNIFEEREKRARVDAMIKEYSYSLRKDLTKEASVLDDPDAVDVVLSLNFINEDSISGYVENIEEMRRISSDLSKMLIASRMGLSDLDESALKKSIHGLNDVIEGLENLKMATEKTAD